MRATWSRTSVLALALPWLLLGAAAARADELMGVVTRVSDGDTLWVKADPAPGTGEADAKPFKLRLQGIDAPERCQPWGPEARAALESRLLRQRVRIVTRAKDDYARTLGNIYIGTLDISAWMVSQGHAWSYRYRRSQGPYAAEEQQARAARRGLFSLEGPMQPRVFRQMHGACE
jgi:endonuclease YncB( thermonuclease family)